MSVENNIDPRGGNFQETECSLDKSTSIGLCMKAPGGPVKFQNPACVAICNDQLGVSCNEDCLSKFSGSCSNNYGRNIQMHGQWCDVLMINRDDQYVIVLTPQDEILEARLEALKSFLITPREFEISAMILKGFSNREIGEHLNIAPSTVKTHLNNIYRKIPKHLLTR